MAIQMRRGFKKDFNPQKMFPGEWAVSIDDDTHNQIVWMCFAAGVVKRMGTYEDFMAQIQDISGDIINKFIAQMTAAQTQLQNKTETYIQGRVDDDWVPELQALVAAAQTSEKNAEDSAKAAGLSEQNAAKAADEAEANKTASAESASAAKEGEAAARKYADGAANSANEAKASETNSEDWSLWSKSYAVGEGGKRPDEEVNSAKYYYEQALRISQGLEGALLPMGTIEFAGLKNATKSPGYMYNISDAFTSDETFADGGSHYYGAGSNVYCTAENKWDVLAAVVVTGVKGNGETIYRVGNVEVAPKNLVLPTTFAAATQRANVAANDSLEVAFAKLAKYCADLKGVAFSGKYSDLDGKPTIPAAAKNGKLIIKQAGKEMGTFTADQGTDTTIELTDNDTDTKYTAGAGLKLTDTTFAANIANNLTTNVEGYALDARIGAQIAENKEAISELNTGLGQIGAYQSAKPIVATIPNGTGDMVKITENIVLSPGVYIVFMRVSSALNQMLMNVSNMGQLLHTGGTTCGAGYAVVRVSTTVAVYAQNYSGAQVTTSSDERFFGLFVVKIKSL